MRCKLCVKVNSPQRSGKELVVECEFLFLQNSSTDLSPQRSDIPWSFNIPMDRSRRDLKLCKQGQLSTVFRGEVRN